LSITVTPANDDPVAVDDSQTVDEDQTATGNVLTNDSDPEGDALSVSGFDIDTDGDGVPEHYNAGDTVTITGVGTLTINSDGSYTFCTRLANLYGQVFPGLLTLYGKAERANGGYRDYWGNFAGFNFV